MKLLSEKISITWDGAWEMFLYMVLFGALTFGASLLTILYGIAER